MILRYKDVELTYDDGYFFHPLTGQPCEFLSQCFFGWSEQSPERALQWAELEDRIQELLLEDYPLDEYPEDFVFDLDWEA